MMWRVIITDTESMTGVAPVCESPEHAMNAYVATKDPNMACLDTVFDCCPHPHIECWSEAGARIVAGQLDLHSAEPCS